MRGGWWGAAGVGLLMLTASARGAEPPRTPKPSQAKTPPQEKAQEPPAEKEFFYYSAGDRRDPFMPLVRNGVLVQWSAGHDSARPALYGILWDPGGQSIALINDLEAKVSDMIGEYQVTEIRQDTVVLMRAGAPLELVLSATAPSVAPASGTTKQTKNVKGGERR